MATLMKLMTGREAGAHTPEESLDPPNPHPDSPGHPHVGWNAPTTPPDDVTTIDEQEVATQGALDTLNAPIGKLAASVEAFSELMRAQREREEPYTELLTLDTVPRSVRAYGRQYNAIIVYGTAGQTLTVTWPGQGAYVKTTVLGWNVLNVPDGAQLSITSGSLQVLYIAAHGFLGNPL
jgi:hypothetical protein